MNTSHGDDLYRYEDIRINFSSNIYSHANLQALTQHLTAKLHLVSNYPEPDTSSVAQIIAKKEGINEDEVLVTNGATEAIYVIAAAYKEELSVINQPTFCEYSSACEAYNHAVFHQFNTIENKEKQRVNWICNPNNPTGSVVECGKLIDIIKQNSGEMFVIDQSYAHYTKKKVPNIKDMVKLNNIILIHSLTKQFCIPGLRIGYVTANKNIINKLKTYRQTWSVNVLAIEAAKFLFENSHTLNLPEINEYLLETKRLQKLINGIEGYKTYNTETNFFLVETTRGKASDLKNFLAKEHKILIRDASNFELLTNGFFRIATQLPHENNQLVEALKMFNA